MIDAGQRQLEDQIARLEPEIERLLRRFRIPREDAQTMLDELVWALLVKIEQIRSPERWLMLTLRNRCLNYWRRRRTLYQAIDRALRTLLSSAEIDEVEKEEVRRQLTGWLAGIDREHRRVLARRYGLEDGPDHGALRPPDLEEAAGERVLAALAALVRRMMRRPPED